MGEGNETPGTQRVECPAKKDWPVRLFLMGLIALAGLVWCILDWGDYPRPEEPFSMERLNPYAGWLFNHYVGPIICGVGALLLFGLGRRALKRVMVADAEGIGYQGKDRIRWEHIKSIDASQLQKRQILYLDHPDGRLKLDGMDLRNFKQLVAFVEEHTPSSEGS